MRMVLTAALMMAAATAWANEPSTTEAEPEAAAQTTEAEPEAAAQPTEAQAAEQPTATATEEAPAAEAKAEEEKPFKVPSGYRARTIGGKMMYCTKNVVVGSRFGKESCRTEAQLRELEGQKAPVPTNPTCSGVCSSK